MRTTGVLGCLALALVSCDTSTATPATDLPDGWRGAISAGLSQSDCTGGVIGRALLTESVTFTARAGAIEVHYADAHFRCEQPVEAFVTSDGADFNVLVQPVDMDPIATAMCDCTYDLDVTFAAASGAHIVSVYRRWDNINSPNDPVLIGSGEVVVP
jgi:hypothetical protein